MSFYKFLPEDIINTEIQTFPRQIVYITSNVLTGSIPLERPYLRNELKNRRYSGYSERLGGYTEKDGPFSASVEVLAAFSRRY